MLVDATGPSYDKKFADKKRQLIDALQKVLYYIINNYALLSWRQRWKS